MSNTNHISLESIPADPCKGKRVVICEDHPATRLGFRTTCRDIGCLVVAETDKGAEAIEFVESQRPDLLILDQFLADEIEGQQVHREIRRRGLSTKVFVITSYCDSPSFFDWINQPDGPDGVLEKNTSLYELRTAITQVLMTGMKYIPDNVWNREQAGDRNPLSKLAPHELRLLREVAKGEDRLNTIAKRQGIAPSTARAYMNDIYHKLGLSPHTLLAAGTLYRKWVRAGNNGVPRESFQAD